MTTEQFLFLLGGAIFGGIIAALGLRSRAAALRSQLEIVARDLAAARVQVASQQEANAQLREKVAGLTKTVELEKASNEKSLEVLDRATDELRESFQVLAAQALKSNNQSFLELAKTSLGKFQNGAELDLEARQKAVEHLVAPIQDSLSKVDRQIQQMEKERSQAYGNLTQQVKSLIGTQDQLRAETGNLVKALRTPSVRGRWGEIQLRRVVEMAGMLPYCDFAELCW